MKEANILPIFSQKTQCILLFYSDKTLDNIMLTDKCYLHSVNSCEKQLNVIHPGFHFLSIYILMFEHTAAFVTK